MTTFREWVHGRTPTEEILLAYMADVAEWWNSEFKAAETQRQPPWQMPGAESCSSE